MLGLYPLLETRDEINRGAFENLSIICPIGMGMGGPILKIQIRRETAVAASLTIIENGRYRLN